MRGNLNPGRLTSSMNETDDRDDIVAALVDNVVSDPEDVHLVYAKSDDESGVLSGFRVCIVFRNVVGGTCSVNGMLEGMNMLHWREFCDRFLETVVESRGRDPDTYDWPTPRPRVTLTPEDGGTDIIESVEVEWTVDRLTWLAVREFTDAKAADTDGEEPCSGCDIQIRYRVEPGKTVVVCPECGRIQPICTECTRPEHEVGACDRCELLKKCRKLEELRAKWR